ncbi:glycoside hydrolase family 61 protein, partial [Mycena olivaceomarginata]
VTLPANIAPGAYLIRHEIIACTSPAPGHRGWWPGVLSVQCTKTAVGGSGTGVLKDSALVSLSGVYSDDDPAILVPNIFDTPPAPYT